MFRNHLAYSFKKSRNLMKIRNLKKSKIISICAVLTFFNFLNELK